MIRVLTGGNGAGKTLRMVWHMVEFQRTDPDRPIYQWGINGCCLPGVAELQDAQSWMDCPDGSLIVLDEAQEVFRAAPGATALTPALIALEKHRHRGIDFILTTQHPGFLHTHIRKLNPVHEHLVSLTNNSAKLYEWREINESPATSRDTADFKIWVYPKELFRFYKSSSLHTKRFRLPKAMRKALLFGGLAISGLGFVAYSLWGQAKEGLHPAASSSSAVPGAAPAAAAPVVMDAESYMRQWVPRVAGMPWSAPAYDGRKPVSEPDIYCIEIEREDTLDCHCYSEQVTPVDVPQATCRRLAEGGVYNPFREPPPDGDVRRSFSERDRPASMLPAAAAAGVPAGNAAPGVGDQVYVPPQFGTWNADPFGQSQ